MRPIPCPCVALLALLSIGCAGTAHVDSATAGEPEGLDPRRLHEIAVGYTAAWNSGDPAAPTGFYAPDGALTLPGGEPAVGREAIAEVVRGFQTAFPDQVLLFDRLEIEGERVNYHWTYAGTNTGPGGTGKRVRFSGWESWLLDDEGLVIDSIGNFDTEEYARQLEHGVNSYLYVWAGDPDENDSDFLAVFDASPDSERYGELLSTTPVGRSAGAHHSEHMMPEGGHLVVNGFRSGQSWVIDVRDPRAPTVVATFEGAGPYTSPHSFDRTPEGNLLATFQYTGGDTSVSGGLVELDPMGKFVRGSDAADPVDPELRPYSLAIAPWLDRVITTSTDMSMQYEGSSVQVWSLGGLELLHTLPLPPGPLGTEHLHPAEPRFLPDGRAIVNTFNCGLYLLSELDGPEPVVRFIGSLERDANAEPGMSECSLPVLFQRFWVQTSDPDHAVVVFDIRDPERPVRVSELAFDGETYPHWLSLERGTNRIVLTGAGTQLDGRVVLLEIDPTTGGLRLIDDFGDEAGLGVSMQRESWPHGNTGPAIPHGAVFSR